MLPVEVHLVFQRACFGVQLRLFCTLKLTQTASNSASIGMPDGPTQPASGRNGLKDKELAQLLRDSSKWLREDFRLQIIDSQRSKNFSYEQDEGGRCCVECGRRLVEPACFAGDCRQEVPPNCVQFVKKT